MILNLFLQTDFRGELTRCFKKWNPKDLGEWLWRGIGSNDFTDLWENAMTIRALIWIPSILASFYNF